MNDTERREPAADAIERAAKAMYMLRPLSRYVAPVPLLPDAKFDEAEVIPFEELGDHIQQKFRLMARTALAAVEPEPGLSLDAMLRHLTDDDLPGKTLSIYRHDGQWGAQQHMTHLEEQYPTDVCGHGDGVLEAIADAVARVKGEEAGL